MKYCTLDDIKQEMKQFTISSTSVPTEAEVENFIIIVSEDEMEPKLREIVDIPIEDSMGLKYLRTVAIKGVVSKIYEALQADIDRINYYRNLFEKSLQLALGTPTMLIGSESSSKQGCTSSYDSTRELRYPRDERQW